MSDRYPEIMAGTEVDGDLLRSMLPRFIIKGATETRPSTASFSNDDELVISLEASATYWVEFFLIYGSTTTAGIKFQWGVPSGASGVKTVLGSHTTAADHNNVAGRFGAHNFSTEIQYGTRNNSALHMGARETGVITTSSAGNLALRWCQVTSNATATQVAAGSFVRVTRLA